MKILGAAIGWSQPEAEAVCRHCLHILTAEMTKKVKFSTIRLMIINQYLSRRGGAVTVTVFKTDVPEKSFAHFCLRVIRCAIIVIWRRANPKNLGKEYSIFYFSFFVHTSHIFRLSFNIYLLSVYESSWVWSQPILMASDVECGKFLKDGKNRTSLLCQRCSSIILRPNLAVFTEKEVKLCRFLPCIYLVRPRQPIIDQQGPELSGLIHEEAHPVAPYLL